MGTHLLFWQHKSCDTKLIVVSLTQNYSLIYAIEIHNSLVSSDVIWCHRSGPNWVRLLPDRTEAIPEPKWIYNSILLLYQQWTSKGRYGCNFFDMYNQCGCVAFIIRVQYMYHRNCSSYQLLPYLQEINELIHWPLMIPYSITWVNIGSGCMTALSYHLNTNADFSLMRFCDIHL